MKFQRFKNISSVKTKIYLIKLKIIITAGIIKKRVFFYNSMKISILKTLQKEVYNIQINNLSFYTHIKSAYK